MNYILNFINKYMPIKDFIFSLVLLIIIIFGYNSLYHSREGINNIIPSLEVVKNKDINGNVISSVTTGLYTQKEVDNLTDSLKKAWKIKGNTQSFTQFIDRVDTEFKDKPFYLDTANYVIFARDSSEYADISFLGNSKTQIGNFHLKLSNDTLTEITTEKKHWFKPNVFTTSIEHSNKLITTTLGDSYQIEVPQDKWVIGPSIGVQYFYSENKFVPYIGFGVSYNLFHFGKKQK